MSMKVPGVFHGTESRTDTIRKANRTVGSGAYPNNGIAPIRKAPSAVEISFLFEFVPRRESRGYSRSIRLGPVGGPSRGSCLQGRPVVCRGYSATPTKD